MNRLRYLSVCSGIEAASVAWLPLGWTPVGFAEIETFPSRVLAQRHGSNMPGESLSGNAPPNFGDFTAIPLDQIGAVDLLVGGTPCQAFSVAGLRQSLADARGNLTLAFAVLAHELARSHGLRWAVWENVPGVLNTPDNAFGCLLGALVGHDGAIPAPRGRKWPDAGMVGGPWARAAWRIFDAQYFGLAQRRRRVFVVVGFGDETDPAAVLFERQGLRRHPPSRGEAGQDPPIGALGGTSPGGGWRVGADEAAAGQLIAFGIDADCLDRSGEGSGASAGERSGLGVRPELAQSLRAKRPGAVAYGGNDTRGPIDVATALNAHGGPHGRQDFESETFVVTHSLRGEGFDASEDGTGRGTPIVPAAVPILGGRARAAEPAPILESSKRTGNSSTSSKAGDGIGAPGDPMFTLGVDSRHAIAFDCKAGGDTGFAIGDVMTALRGVGHGSGHAAVAFQQRFRGDDGRGYDRPPPISSEVTGALETVKPWNVATAWAVRRLTPTECHRLQGFPDDHCAIPGAADGPIYKALGNSMAVPCMRWIGERIAAADGAIVPLLQAAE